MTPDTRRDEEGEVPSAGAALRARTAGEAVHVFRDTLSKHPADIATASRLVAASEILKDREELAVAWTALADALRMSRRPREAANCYDRALSLRPNAVKALEGLGMADLALADPERAIEHFRAALRIAPCHLRLHSYLAGALFLTGQHHEAWAEFSFYYIFRQDKWGRYEQPLWDGTALHGRRVLLWAENGRGDIIQFLRYIDFAAMRGGRVIVECTHKSLLTLIRRKSTVETVVSAGAILPPFDVHAPLLYFPALFPNCRDLALSPFPYLYADEDAIARWSARLAGSRVFKVGICWRANPSHPSAGSRFVPLALFAALTQVPGVRVISLQYGASADEFLSHAPDVENVCGEVFSIDEAAALMMALDLVISVDTMVAHLAGSLGRPVWTLLRYAADWRWGMSGETTAWYPTMRLFRQKRIDEWQDVMEGVKEALEVVCTKQALQVR